jgi:hypothetical protein
MAFFILNLSATCNVCLLKIAAASECSLPFPKDANDALRSGFDIVKMIQNESSFAQI